MAATWPSATSWKKNHLHRSCRRHEAAKALFARMLAEGPAPDHTSYANIVRSHLSQALGWHRQPQGYQLSE